MKKLDLTQKKQISGAGAAKGGLGFWGGAIGGSILTQTVLDALRFVLNFVDGSGPADNHRTRPHYDSGRPSGSYGYGSYGNFLASHAVMHISKYPSRTTMRLGLPWE